MSAVVLDASAVLAVINAERGAERVVEFLADGAILSTVNYAEIATKLVERKIDLNQAKSIITKIGIQIIEYGIDLAGRTGELREQTRHLGLSLADRACLALAERERLPAVTADRKWATVDLGIDIRFIR